MAERMKALTLYQPCLERPARAMFARTHDEPWEEGEALTLDIYMNDARTCIESVLLNPSEEVVEAAARANSPQRWSNLNAREQEREKGIARAALRAAGLRILGREERET